MHRGRRSGRTYETPVAVRRTADGFVIALAFGTQVDWYRNLQAAGAGGIRWCGRDYAIGAPRSLDEVQGMATFNVVQRVSMRLGRIHDFIAVSDLSATRR
jgi:deazaflavin-dependent oxidoreductase (nitroreductase family)